jgi:hypothetical protein
MTGSGVTHRIWRVERWWVTASPNPPFYNHALSDATPSISISIFGSGSATTTQVVRAG